MERAGAERRASVAKYDGARAERRAGGHGAGMERRAGLQKYG